MAYKNTIADQANVAALISQIETLLVAAGWTIEVAGSPNVLKSAADAAGRVCRMSLFEDSSGNLACAVAPTLNGAGTALSTSNRACRGTQFATGSSWTLYAYAENFMLLRDAGLSQSAYFLTGGRLSFHSSQNAAYCAWGMYVAGTRAENSAVAFSVYFTGRGYSNGLYVSCPRSGNVVREVGFIKVVYPQYTATAAQPVYCDSFTDGGLLYTKAWLGPSYSGTQYGEDEEFTGYVPNAVLVHLYDETDISPGDTLDIDDGTGDTYEATPASGVNYLCQADNLHLLWKTADA